MPSSSTATTATTDNKKEQRAVSPASSDGSTTVSANSSPGVDQQINEELTPVNRIPNESHFNPINDMYPNHQNSTPNAAREHGVSGANLSHLNGAIECPPRKKSRRSSQQSTQSHASSHPSLNPPASNSSQASNANGTSNSILGTTPAAVGATTEAPKVNNNNQNINSNKENTKPTEFGNNPDIERISDLIKGNMQRSRIIFDGITEAQNQIMKIFDHKSHISDIIHRCASKRNFKKREKA